LTNRPGPKPNVNVSLAGGRPSASPLSVAGFVSSVLIGAAV
jgi:hypothetical protein